MMQVFYRAAAIVRRVNDRLLQRFEEHFDGTATPEPLDARFELRRGYLAARDPDWPHGDAAQVLELFATWASRRDARGLHPRTEERRGGKECVSTCRVRGRRMN